MNTIHKIGLAAVLAFGVSGAAMAQAVDAGAATGAQLGAGTNTQLEVKPGINAGAGANASAGANANANVGIDNMTTGSISNQGNLVSSIQTTSNFDLSAYTDSTTVNCVSVSSLQGDAQGNAQAIDNAATGNAGIATLRSEIEANTALMSKIEASCDVAEFDVNDVVFVQTGADGTLTFYYDDRA